MWFPRTRERIVRREVDASLVERLRRETGYPAALAAILAGRGLSSAEECERFFTPRLADLHDPFTFRDMGKAVARIRRAVRNAEKITVYGDYDVDGITATAMLVRALRKLGAVCDYYLPHRLNEGYGISAAGIDAVAGRGTTLLITVDCGISAVDKVAAAVARGIDVIITDHHEPKDRAPAAVAVLDPKLPGSTYPERTPAGVGVALKLVQALAADFGAGNDFWEEYLDLAAVGTAADIVPLRGENRVIASEGFRRLRRTSNPGLAALIKERGLAGRPLSTSQVVFVLAPCMNAVGRLGDARRGVELLLTDDPTVAASRARELAGANEQRRTLDARVQEAVFGWVHANCIPEEDFAVVAGHETWHAGVVGIVASKVVERFNRPAILLSLGEDGVARGSGRTAAGLHLLDALKECEHLLESYGGHAAAAGLSVRHENIDALRTHFNRVVREKLTADDLVPVIKVDAEVALDTLTPKFFERLKRMEPFGLGNMRPVLLCRNMKARYAPRIVGKGHLKMAATDGVRTMDAIGFNFGDRLDDVRRAATFSLAFTLDENEWNGRKSLQMKLRGVEA